MITVGYAAEFSLVAILNNQIGTDDERKVFRGTKNSLSEWPAIA